MKFHLTRLGKFFAVLMVLFYGASITSQSGLLILFVGLVAGMILINLGAGLRMLKHLRVDAPTEVLIEEGKAMTQPWQLKNFSARPARSLEISNSGGTLLRIQIVPRMETVSKTPDLKFKRRGIYPNDQVRVRTSAPFGLVEVSKGFTLLGRVVVYPAIYLAEPPAASGLDQITGGKFRGGRRSTSGSNFAGVKPWAPGDSIKQIHWKSSAKNSKLMVKIFDEELSGRVSILLDCNGPDFVANENAIRAAGSLLFAALEAGHFVELCEASSAALLVLQPFSDGTEALLRLAEIAVTQTPATLASTQIALSKISRKAAIAYVTSTFDNQKLGALEDLKHENRIVSIYLPLEALAQAGKIEVPAWFFSKNEIVPETSDISARTTALKP